jgi:DNA-binding response OmpR family regulator
VLLVEDHADTLKMLGRLLADRGHTVLAAADCASARAAAGGAVARGQRVDLVIGDIGLPDGDGVDLMCDLKAALNCPVVALSGHGMTEDVRRCAEAGIDRHMLKPVGVLELDESIHHLAGC